MTLDGFERMLQLFNTRAPFRTYSIEFASGDRVHIRHPEAISRNGDFFYFRSPNREQRLFEAGAVIQFIDPPRS